MNKDKTLHMVKQGLRRNKIILYAIGASIAMNVASKAYFDAWDVSVVNWYNDNFKSQVDESKKIANQNNSLENTTNNFYMDQGKPLDRYNLEISDNANTNVNSTYKSQPVSKVKVDYAWKRNSMYERRMRERELEDLLLFEDEFMPQKDTVDIVKKSYP